MGRRGTVDDHFPECLYPYQVRSTDTTIEDICTRYGIIESVETVLAINLARDGALPQDLAPVSGGTPIPTRIVPSTRPRQPPRAVRIETLWLPIPRFNEGFLWEAYLLGEESFEHTQRWIFRDEVRGVPSFGPPGHEQPITWESVWNHLFNANVVRQHAEAAQARHQHAQPPPPSPQQSADVPIAAPPANPPLVGTLLYLPYARNGVATMIPVVANPSDLPATLTSPAPVPPVPDATEQLVYDARDWIRRFGVRSANSTGYFSQADRAWLPQRLAGEACLTTVCTLLGGSQPNETPRPIPRDPNHTTLPPKYDGLSDLTTQIDLTRENPGRSPPGARFTDEFRQGENPDGRILPDRDAYDGLLAYLSSELALGHPVVVGVSFHLDDDNIKDHYIVVVAEGVETDGRRFWQYYDPGSGSESTGTGVTHSRASDPIGRSINRLRLYPAAERIPLAWHRGEHGRVFTTVAPVRLTDDAWLAPSDPLDQLYVLRIDRTDAHGWYPGDHPAAAAAQHAPAFYEVCAYYRNHSGSNTRGKIFDHTRRTIPVADRHARFTAIH